MPVAMRGMISCDLSSLPRKKNALRCNVKRQWAETKNARQGRKRVVNLEDVSRVDSEGEKLLPADFLPKALR